MDSLPIIPIHDTIYDTLYRTIEKTQYVLNNSKPDVLGLESGNLVPAIFGGLLAGLVAFITAKYTIQLDKKKELELLEIANKAKYAERGNRLLHKFISNYTMLIPIQVPSSYNETLDQCWRTIKKMHLEGYTNVKAYDHICKSLREIPIDRDRREYIGNTNDTFLKLLDDWDENATN